VDYGCAQNRVKWAEVDFETVNPPEAEKFLEINIEKYEFKMKLRNRSPLQANLFKNINIKQRFVKHFWVDSGSFEPLRPHPTDSTGAMLCTAYMYDLST
jgi:hypothetical protein